MSSAAAYSKIQHISWIISRTVDFSFKRFSFISFLQNRIHFWLISLQQFGRHVARDGCQRRDIFIDLKNSFIFVWGKILQCVCVFSPLEQFHWLKIFSKYIWGGMEKHPNGYFSKLQRMMLWITWSKLVYQAWHYIWNEHRKQPALQPSGNHKYIVLHEVL